MKLIFLHGPPASGKFTIAEALQRRCGIRNFHNHLTVDVAKALFEFGTPAFWQLVHKLRLLALEAIAAEPDACVVFTNCYSSPEDDARVLAIERVVTSQGGEFIPVYLACDVEELMRRISLPARIKMDKLATKDGLQAFLQRWNCVALDRPHCIEINTEGRSANDCADEISRRIGLREHT